MISLYKHNARSFYDVYNPLRQYYPKYPDWVFNEIGANFDHQSELTNAIATDILYPNTRESAYSFAASCDYDPVEADGASVVLTITLVEAKAKTLSVGHQFGGTSSISGEMAIYELTASASSGGTNTITATAKQKRTFTNIDIGTVTSNEDFKDYPIDGYRNIIKSSISLTIDGLGWTRVDNFDDSVSTDRHFQFVYQSSGKSRIRFGDGVTGLKPSINSSIYATFSTTLGLNGRVNSGDIDTDFGGDSDIDSVTNTASTEGNNSESVSAIIRNSRANVRMKNGVWSKEDVETAALQSSASVLKAYCVPALGSCGVYIVPTGGGSPSSVLTSAVEAYVKALTPFGKFPVTCAGATYVPISITGEGVVKEGYTSSPVLNLMRWACVLATSCFDSLVLESYNEDGISTCRTDVINSLWSYSFTEDDEAALTAIIEKWVSLLGSREYREFGQLFDYSQIWTMSSLLYDYGLESFNLISPTSSTTVSSNQIISTGTITITEVS